jgi:hypothetical protein
MVGLVWAGRRVVAMVVVKEGSRGVTGAAIEQVPAGQSVLVPPRKEAVGEIRCRLG